MTPRRTAWYAVSWSSFSVQNDRGRNRDFEVLSSRGGLLISYASGDWRPIRPSSFRFEPAQPPRWDVFSFRRESLPYPLPDPGFREPLVTIGGFQLAWQWDASRNGADFNLRATEVGIVVPYWALGPAAAALAAWRLHRARKLLAKRHEGSVPCSACGYDLRATPGRCPECGTRGSVSTAR